MNRDTPQRIVDGGLGGLECDIFGFSGWSGRMAWTDEERPNGGISEIMLRYKQIDQNLRRF